MTTWTLAKSALRNASPLGWLIAEGAEVAAKSMAIAAGKGVDELKVESVKQDIRSQFDQQQAKTAQELAIAERISNAEEVYIEEFYDTSDKGNVGISLDGDSTTVGIGASGRRVVKRTYRFTGWKQSEERSTPDAFGSTA